MTRERNRLYHGIMNLGFSEMFFIFLLALIIFGPKKLPEIGRQIGKALAEFKRASNEFKYQLESEMRQMETEGGGGAADNSLANGIGRAVAEFQRVGGEVRARLEGGVRQLEAEANPMPTPAPSTVAEAPAAPEPEPVPPAKGADA